MEKEKQFDSAIEQKRQQVDVPFNPEAVGDFEWLLQNAPMFDEGGFAKALDAEGKRLPATPEQKAEMDSNFSQLGHLLEGCDASWFLGGAANVSMMNKGEYIGYHKDIDLMVEARDLEKLEKHLKEKGYGIFIKEGENEENQETTWRRVGGKKLKEDVRDIVINKKAWPHDISINKIDEKGSIVLDEPLNFIDLYPLQRNDEGLPVGCQNVVLPEKWLEGQPIPFQDTQLNLAHPALFAYFKLRCERPYDMNDLEKMVDMGKLKEADIKEIGKVYEKEFDLRMEEGKKILEPLLRGIRPDISASEISNLFLESPEIQDKLKVNPKKGAAALESLAKIIEAMPDKPSEKIRELILGQQDSIRQKFFDKTNRLLELTEKNRLLGLINKNESPI